MSPELSKIIEESLTGIGIKELLIVPKSKSLISNIKSDLKNLMTTLEANVSVYSSIHIHINIQYKFNAPIHHHFSTLTSYTASNQMRIKDVPNSMEISY